ncbi:hypothetical protein [Blastococcus sp. SYSU D00695]
MPSPRRPLTVRRRSAGVAVGTVLALLAGCSSGDDERQPGDPVTQAEAGVLAGLLARNAEEGGADFVVTAPYGEDALLTLTGEVDYAGAVGRAQAVTSPGDGGPEQTRTVFFTADELWFGEVPGLEASLAAAGLPAAGYVHRPAAALADGAAEAPLTDVLVRLVLGLATADADDPAAFRGGEHTWEGQRSVDGRLSTVFGSAAGWTVTVDSSSDLLLQYVTPLPGLDSPVTVTLDDHGPREVTPPAPEETADGAAYPELLTGVGL